MEVRKKKSNQPAWHADFRRTDELPDVKAVRTGFLVNFVAIAIAVWICVQAYLTMEEAEKYDEDLQATQTDVSNLKPRSDAAEKVDKRFSELANRLKAFQRFYQTNVDAFTIFSNFAATMPDNVAVNYIRIDTNVRRGEMTRVLNTAAYMEFQGSQSFTAVDDYLAALQESEIFPEADLAEVTKSGQVHDEGRGVIRFNLQFTSTPTTLP